MQVQLRHIQKRGNSFFFRLAIPADLQVHFNGHREISKALQASDPFSAFVKAGELRDRYKGMFHSFRHGNPIPIESDGLADYSSPPNITPFSQPIEQAPLLSVVLDELLLARSCKYTSTLARKSAIRVLIDWYGDLPINQYTRRMLLAFRDDGLLRLPPNLYKNDKYLGKSVRSVAEKSHAQAMKPATVNHKLGHLNTVFNYAVKYGYLNINPIVDLMLQMEKAPSKERDGYSADQLQRIVNSLAEQTASGDDIRHQRFWVTLSCLYTGARLNEIAQLSVSDLCIVDDIPCFNITTEGEVAKSLKNSRSCRLIPIHPLLIDLGLLRYHQQRVASHPDPARTPLWHCVCDHGEGNWGRKMSRWFNDRFRPIFLTDEELSNHKSGKKNYCFHSLRHSWIAQAQNQAQMNPRIEMRLTGHADAFISDEHARYGKDMHPSIMLKELVKLDYGLDLSAVMGRY